MENANVFGIFERSNGKVSPANKIASVARGEYYKAAIIFGTPQFFCDTLSSTGVCLNKFLARGSLVQKRSPR